MRFETTLPVMAAANCKPSGVRLSLEPASAERVARIAKSLGDPIRLQIAALLTGWSGEICQCELTPLFDVSQPTLSHHLGKLVDAEILAVRRDGTWAYYSAIPASEPLVTALLSR